jgi:hypothetical protein
MKARVSVVLATSAPALLAGVHAGAAQPLTERVLAGCEAELRDHCGEMTPSEGRIRQCLEGAGARVGAECTRALADVGLRR